MGKQGPCRHCGVTSTPLWRNGPPEKPVLCNACGSRWRTKGSLVNYTPLHAREPLDSEEFTISKQKTVSFKPKDQKSYKKKQTVRFKNEMAYSGVTSNRSSSGSAISYSESCARFGTTEASDLTGSAQSIAVPSKKTTCATHAKPSSVEKLTKELHSILHEQSHLSVSSEEDLLYEFGSPMNSFEIGHGGILLRCLESKTVEEESEATSLAIDNKACIIRETYSAPPSFPSHGESKETSYQNICSNELDKSTAEVTEEHVKREKVSNETLNVLRDRDSPLISVDLKDIANYEIFMKHTTHEEQQRLMKYLTSEDIVKPPESLQIMFQSPQFMETFSYFRKLLLEGTFDLSFIGDIRDPSRTLERLVLCNPTKTKWIEHYEKIKVSAHQITGVKNVSSTPTFLAPIKRPYDHQNQQYQDIKGLMRSPRRVLKSSNMNPPSMKLSQPSSGDVGSKDIHDLAYFLENEGPCVSPRSIFASPPDQSSMLASLQFTGESCDQDVQLGLGHNASFSEAEHFHPRNSKTGKSSSPSESGVAEGEPLFNNPSSSMSSQHQRRW